ncbi:hypothetical protein ANO14919_031800 [Xylariales sp. No.14919]|nr:hypothetical protein ANO14919_031800 [Xylariales sp. No.14919]
MSVYFNSLKSITDITAVTITNIIASVTVMAKLRLTLTPPASYHPSRDKTTNMRCDGDTRVFCDPTGVCCFDPTSERDPQPDQPSHKGVRVSVKLVTTKTLDRTSNKERKSRKDEWTDRFHIYYNIEGSRRSSKQTLSHPR